MSLNGILTSPSATFEALLDGAATGLTGSDGTHPTKAGHAYIARCVAGGLARVL